MSFVVRVTGLLDNTPTDEIPSELRDPQSIVVAFG